MFVVLLVVRVDQVMAFLRFPRYLYDATFWGQRNRSRTQFCVTRRLWRGISASVLDSIDAAASALPTVTGQRLRCRDPLAHFR